MASITLPIRGGAVTVDEADAGIVRQYPWRVRRVPNSQVVYAVYQRLSLHRLIAGAGRGQNVDHANSDGLDNRRSNLRLCSHAENMQNRRPPTGPKNSRFKGVMLTDRLAKPYYAEIEAFGTRVYLGAFVKEEQAAKAYDRAARIFHGKFAKTNEMLGLLAPSNLAA